MPATAETRVRAFASLEDYLSWWKANCQTCARGYDTYHGCWRCVIDVALIHAFTDQYGDGTIKRGYAALVGYHDGQLAECCPLFEKVK